eukprot:CAMPEP_0174881574 /NCGR_PEP_ID=MMETSP1114-20130205/84330_1 /TAXON_ID=312471 /ORGANISM="Neobodo designis, Strain CCAP 1951/1" /LENGTH=755 /DNA_ID=CAMNT_0016116971 /DNA_START=50 /DNA_END=2317 /DNA_ORIENTATION=+
MINKHGCGVGPAPFHRTVDVLELVCEAVGVVPDDGATLMALRRCSKAWADAVSTAVRRGDWPDDDAADRPSGAMAPEVARIPAAAAPVRRLAATWGSAGVADGDSRDRDDETVGVVPDDGATLMALRRCSMVWADAVSTAVRRGDWHDDDSADRAAGAMAPEIARIPVAARLCVVSQQRGAVREWLTVIPATVTSTRDADVMLRDVRTLFAHVPRPTALEFDSNGAALTREVMGAIAGAVGATLQSLKVARASLAAAAVESLLGFVALTELSLTDHTLDEVPEAALIAAAAGFPRLLRLDLSRNAGAAVTGRTISAFAVHHQQLEHLNVAGALGSASSDCVDGIATHCKRLQFLDVSYSHGVIAPDALAAVGECCAQLQHLHVAFTGNTMTAASVASIAKNCPQLRTLDLSQNARKPLEILTAISEVCSNLTSINLTRTCFGPIDAQLAGIAKRCPRLQRMDLRSCELSNVGLTAIADNCHRLLELDLGHIGGKPTSAGLEAIAERCPTLQRLEVRSCEAATDASIAAIGRHCPSLRELDVSENSGRVTDEGVLCVARNCPRLRVLHVEGSFWDGKQTVTDAAIIEVARFCRKLEELSVRFTHGNVTDVSIRQVAMDAPGEAATDASIAAIACRCPALRELDVSENPGRVTDEGVLSVARNCPELRILRVEGTIGGSTHTVTDAGITEVARCCRKLEELSVRFAKGSVTDVSIRQIAMRCPRLHYLNVVFTSGTVTDECVAFVKSSCPGVTVEAW